MRTAGVFVVLAAFLVLLLSGCEARPVGEGEAAATIRLKLESIGGFVTEGDGFDTGLVTTASGHAAVIGRGRLWLKFEDGQIRWQISDYGDECIYRVDSNGHITGTSYYGATHEGQYYPDTKRLEWDGRWYVPD